MSTQVAPTKDLRAFVESPAVKSRLQEMLGKRATQFTTSLLQVVNSNKLLQNASKESIYTAAMTAAVLDLPIQNNLGYAWIVPYNKEAQFQIGWKGLVQLAQRSGQYKSIGVLEVYENQFESFNALTEELKGNFDLAPDGKVVGYAAYFKLVNGFEKTTYWSLSQVTAHGLKYSKSFKFGPWKDNFDAMAKKTVLKSLLSKWGPMSVDVQMQIAMKADQAVVTDVTNETVDVEYVDQSEPMDAEEKRIREVIQSFTEKSDAISFVDGLDSATADKYSAEIEEELLKFA
jgi:recombination protein RecT